MNNIFNIPMRIDKVYGYDKFVDSDELLSWLLICMGKIRFISWELGVNKG